MRTQKIRQITYIFDYEDYDILKQKMKNIGIQTFTELARKIKVSNSYLSYVVTGQKAVTIKFFKKLKNVGIDMEVLEND